MSIPVRFRDSGKIRMEAGMRNYRWLITVLMALFLTGCQKSDGEPTLVEMGMSAIEEADYVTALDSFQSAIDLKEDELLAYRGKGIAYIATGEYSEAVSALNQAWKLTDDRMDETRKDILYYKAAALYRQSDYVGTISVCDTILDIAREADAYYLRGTCYLEQEEEDKAKVNFDAAVKKTPEDYDLYLNIYESYRSKNLSAEGDVYLQKAMAIEAGSEEEAYQKARIHLALEEYDKAKAELDALAEENNQEALLLMGEIYQAMGDYPHSRSMYERYMETYGETPFAYNGAVMADIGEGNYDTALQNIAKGLKLDEERGKQDLMFNEIVVYENKKEFSAAREKAADYVQRYPGDEAGKKEYEFLKTR